MGDDDHRTGHPPPHSDVTARWGHHLGHGYRLSLVCCFACCPWLPGFLTFLTFSGHWLLLSNMPTGICLALVMRRLCSTIYYDCLVQFFMLHVCCLIIVVNFDLGGGPTVQWRQSGVAISPSDDHHHVVWTCILGVYFVFKFQVFLFVFSAFKP